MSKKDYIDAINEIKGSDNLKNKTLNKIKEKKNNWKLYTTLSMVAICIVAIVIAIPLTNNNEQLIPIGKVATTGDSILPVVGTFENFYEIVSDNPETVWGRGGLLETQSVTDAVSTNTAEVSKEESADFSTTNTQVAGVDEADIVKTDGNYIYYIAGSKVIILQADTLQILSEIKYNDNEQENYSPLELYINGNKLIIIGNKYIYNGSDEDNEYYYFTSSEEYTIAEIYNIENRSQPDLEREIEIEGYYVSSRMIDGNIYMLANKYMYVYMFQEYDIDELEPNDFKPVYRDTAIGTEMQTLNYDCIYYFPDSEDTNYLNIAGFNIHNSEPAQIETYLGAGDTVYASEDNMYITQTEYKYEEGTKYRYAAPYEVNTNIYKFSLDNSKFTFIAKGSVTGVTLNQFSMDESNGLFRIATTTQDFWWNEDDKSVNNLYVLNENLETVGKIEGLAEGERIYSVRFMGNRAYIVTFVQTDPLFVIDLSDPTNPTVLGELKIPGYSKYLHPYDETHIIGFGEDTKLENYGYGEFVTTNGMKMALFDVSDPTNPIEMYSTKIGDKGTWSELLYNHKALLFSKEKNIIAFPISICENQNDRYSNLKFQGAIIYGLDLENGFTLKGQISHVKIENDNYYWEYDYNKAIERIIYIKDNLYTLSDGLVKSTNMNTMEEVNSTEIEIEENYGITYSHYID